jgi:hypothetical protein
VKDWFLIEEEEGEKFRMKKKSGKKKSERLRKIKSSY